MIDTHSVNVGDILVWDKRGYYCVFKVDHHNKFVSLITLHDPKSTDLIVERYSMGSLQLSLWQKHQ
jgi:hypothetical protein